MGGVSNAVSVPTITAAGARAAIDAAVALAEELGVRVVISVVDRGGNPLALLRMDGAFLFSVEVAQKKAWTAAAAGIPTDRLRAGFNQDPTLLHGLAPKVDQLVAVGGGTPVLIDGQVAGAVGVSGATEEQDQQIANTAAQSIGR
jgi:glc operon protein GlcG